MDEEVVSYRRGRNVVLSPPQKTYKYTYNIIQQQRLQQQQQQGHQQEQQEQQRIQRERDEGAFTAVDGADSTSASPDFHQRQNNRHSFLISLKPSDASNENADHYGSNGLNHNIVGENSWQPSAQSSEPTLYEIPFGDSGQHSPSLDSRGTAIGTAGSMEGSNRLVSDITGFTKSLLKTNGQKKQVRVIDDAENISVTFHYEPLLDDKLQCSTENTAENNDHQRHTNFVDSFNGTEVKGETCDPFDVEELTSERRPKRRVTPFTYVNTLSAEEMDSSTDHKKDYPITTANTSLATDKGLATFGGADIVIRSRSRSGSAQDLENAKTPRFHLFLGPAIKYTPQSVDYDEQEEGRLVDPENNHLRSSIESLQYSDDSGSATPVKELQRSGFGNVSTKPVIVVEKNMGTTSGSFNDVDDGDLSLLQGEQLDSFLRTSYNSPKLQVLSKPVRTTEAGQSIDEGLAGYSGANEDDEEEEEATEDDYLGDEEFDSYEEVNTLVAASSPTQKDIDSPAKVVMESINEKPVTLIRSISRHHLDSRDSINKSRDQFDAYTSDSNYVLDADASDKEVRPYVDSHGKKLSRLFSDEDNDAEIDYSYFDDQIAYEEQQQQVQRLSKTARNEDSAALRETGIIDSFETQRNSAIDVAVCTAKKAIASDESDEPEEEYDNDFEEAYDDDDFED